MLCGVLIPPNHHSLECSPPLAQAVAGLLGARVGGLAGDVARLEVEKTSASEAAKAAEAERNALRETKATVEREHAVLQAAQTAAREKETSLKTDLAALREDKAAARAEHAAQAIQRAMIHKI